MRDLRRLDDDGSFSLVEMTEADEQFERKAAYSYAAFFWCLVLLVLGMLAVGVAEWAARMGWV